MRFAAVWIASGLLASWMPIHAQDRDRDRGLATSVYKVELHIGDSQNTANPDRHYTMILDNVGHGEFKVGNRVPVAVGSYQPGTGGNTPAMNTQFSYIDVGVNIECRVREAGNRVGFHGTIELSNIVQPTGTAAVNQVNPTVGQTKVDLDATLELGKQTVIALIEDPSTSRQLGVQATVTRLN